MSAPVDLLPVLRAHVKAKYGTQVRAAAAWGVTGVFVNMVLQGQRTPNATILADAGLVRVVQYYHAHRGTPDADPWHQAVLDACMAVEACYIPDNPAATLNCLIDWHVGLARENLVDVWQLVELRDRINAMLGAK
jgi:hypothetical protein